MKKLLLGLFLFIHAIFGYSSEIQTHKGKHAFISQNIVYTIKDNHVYKGNPVVFFDDDIIYTIKYKE